MNFFLLFYNLILSFEVARTMARIHVPDRQVCSISHNMNSALRRHVFLHQTSFWRKTGRILISPELRYEADSSSGLNISNLKHPIKYYSDPISKSWLRSGSTKTPLRPPRPGWDTTASHQDGSTTTKCHPPAAAPPHLPLRSCLGDLRDPRSRLRRGTRARLLAWAWRLGFCGGFCRTTLGFDCMARSAVVLAHPENPVSEKVEIRFLHSSRAGHSTNAISISPRIVPAPTLALLMGHSLLPTSPASVTGQTRT